MLPGLDGEVSPDMTVKVTRVVEAWVFESEDIPFETLWRSDGALELDQRRTDQPGELGVRKRRVRIVYEDGEEKRRLVADEWVERQPVTRIVSYGTKIIMREVEGMSYAEMAKAMNVSKGTIMSRLHHARQKLQRALGEYVQGEMVVR